MAQQIVTFTNSNGLTATFSNFHPFIFSGLSGVSEIVAENNTDTTAYRDGEFYKYTTISKRQMILKCLIVTNTKQLYMQRRRELLALFNPKNGEGELTYVTNGITRKIKCIADGFPDIPITKRAKKTALEIPLLAFNPNFYNDDEDVTFSETLGGLHFPLAITSAGTNAGYKILEYSKFIKNEGDSECGIIATFTATGADVIKEVLQNITMGETLTLNVALDVGDQIIINTNYGSKSITKVSDGIETDILNKLELPSDFIKLDIGENYISYNESSLNLSLNIEYTPVYLGV